MNDEEIRLIKGYFNDGYCCDLDELKNIANKMIKENNKLQSNWNSLREWLKDLIIYEEMEDSTYYLESIQVLQDVLDKMNELEGKINNGK